MKTDSCWGPTALILREPLPTSVWQRHSCQWKQIQKITRQVLTKPNRVFAVSLLLPESTCVLLRPPPLQSTQTLRSLTLINIYYMHLQQHPRFFVFFSACWSRHKLQKLYCGCVGARMGRARSLQNPTPSRPPCSFHPQQPAAPPATKVRCNAVKPRTHPVRSAAGAAQISFLLQTSKMFPSHTGDAKHPAGLQRDPAKLRQVTLSIFG